MDVIADEDVGCGQEWSAIEAYQASLGHKANHTFTQPNAKYDKCFHPRFGNIMSIRTISDVKAGEEILVDYSMFLPQTWLLRFFLQQVLAEEWLAGYLPWFVVRAEYTNQCPKWYLEAKKRFQETGADTKKQKR